MNSGDTNRTPARHLRFSVRTMLLGLTGIAVLTALLVPPATHLARWREHNALTQRVVHRITTMKSRKPTGVPGAQWSQAVDWTANLIAQVYFSPIESDPDSLRQLAESLDERARGQVDLSTLQWIWDECEKAPRDGAEYAIRFRDVRGMNKEPITDDDVPHLWSLDKCLYLDLSNTQVTDSGIECLARLSNLKSISLEGTRVTPVGLAKLKASLPDCEIRITPPAAR